MADTQIIVGALVSKARAMNTGLAGSGTAWLEEQRDAALAGVIAGDVQVSYAQFAGAAASGSPKLGAQDLLELFQLALDQLAADPDGNVEAASGATTVYMDFSRRFVSA